MTLEQARDRDTVRKLAEQVIHSPSFLDFRLPGLLKLNGAIFNAL